MQFEHSIAAAANKVGIVSGGTAIAGWAYANELAAIVGALAAVASVGIGWYYKRKADRRDQELHAERMKHARDEAPE